MRPLIVTTLLLFLATANAQERCGAHSLTQRWLQEQGRSTELRGQLDRVVKGVRKGGAQATIPVVVHVVWNTSAENVATALIQDMIATMNEDYQNLNSDFNTVRPVFAADRGNPAITFCLASIDPNGNPTTGITRTQTSDTWLDPDTETNDMKSPPKGISPWDPDRYLNIWICDIASGLGGGFITLGYAYLPVGGMVGSAIDGVVIDYNYGLQPGSRTATHEAGHYLGLEHPWGNGGCGSSDGMADTPVTDEATFSCSNPNLTNCGVLTQYENFMDYADCTMMFTNDQSAYMNSILFGARAGLLSGGGCGIVNTGPCIPTSAAGTSDGDFIDGVQLGTINNLNSGGVAGPSYTDYSGIYATTLQRGSSYTVTITSGDYVPDNYAAWIDLDQDDVFELNEKLGEWQNTAAGQSTNFTFIVPAGATLGTTVMRVRGVYFNQGEPVPVDPCFAYDYGETEDYGITITSGGPNYCIPTSVNGTSDGDFLDGVVLEGISNTGTGGVAGPTYVDYTAQSTQLIRGNTYTLSLTSGSYTEDLLGAWIDLNANGTFETNELLGDALTSSAFETVDISFTVPANASLGTTRLRARCIYPGNGQPTSVDPCFNFTWGETEDYTVVIATSTGASAPEALGYAVHPIPADDLLRVTLPAAGSTELTVFDALGRCMARYRPEGPMTVLDVSGLANGHHLLRCASNGQVTVVPFVVQHGR